MYHVFVLTDREAELGLDPRALREEGVSYDAGTEVELDRYLNGSGATRPDAVLLDMDSVGYSRVREIAHRCQELGLPELAVVSADRLDQYDSTLNHHEFVLRPFRAGELSARLKQAIFKLRGTIDSKGIRVGELTIDPERYEVSLAGRRVILTYKEYQLLVLLASNPGRVYTRDALLRQVWGYDYFGGTRTVDVHVRRLRSKIENGGHSFIETVWNVGYRFKPSP